MDGDTECSTDDNGYGTFTIWLVHHALVKLFFNSLSSHMCGEWHVILTAWKILLPFNNRYESDLRVIVLVEMSDERKKITEHVFPEFIISLCVTF